MFKKAIRFDTPATDTPGSTTEYYGLLRSTTVTAGLNPYSSGMLIRECVTQALGPRKMRVPYSDRSVRTCVCASVRLERNGYVNFAVPIGATFSKLVPTVHLDTNLYFYIIPN